MNVTIFNKISDLKTKFKSLFQHKKKLSALENFSSAAPFPQKTYLTLIRHCMHDGFLGEEEADFLDHLLNKYEVNYLDWSHKTMWLKREMQKMSEKACKPALQPFFDFDKPRTPVHVPIEILAIRNSVKGIRI